MDDAQLDTEAFSKKRVRGRGDWGKAIFQKMVDWSLVRILVGVAFIFFFIEKD